MRNRFRLLFSIFTLFIIAGCSSSAQQTNLSVVEFEKAIAQKDIQILDVRTREEYQSGHIRNAFLADWNNEEEFKSRVRALDKNKPVYTYCLSGARSDAATQWMRKNGFTAYNLNGGINAWRRAEKPIEQLETRKQISYSEYMAQIPSDKTILVDIGATWCPPCKKMAPVIDSLVSKEGSRFVLVKIDGGEQTNICKELNVDGFPTFILYKNGKEIWRKQGLVDLKEFSEKL